MAGAEQVGLDLSIDELVALCGRLGLPPAPVPGPGPLDGLHPDQEQAVLASAERSLVARGILDPASAAVLPAVAELLGIVAAPTVVARATRRRGGRLEPAVFVAVPGIGVELRTRGIGVHRLVPFDAADLVARLVEAAGIEARHRDDGAGPAHVEEFPVASALLGEVGDLVASGDGAAAAARLSAAALPDDLAAALAVGVGQRWEVATIAVVHRPAPELLEGGEVTTLDLGTGGLWQANRLDEEHLVLSRTTVRGLVDEVAALLPSVLSAPVP